MHDTAESITTSRMPFFYRQIWSLTMRQRLTLLWTCSIAADGGVQRLMHHMLLQCKLPAAGCLGRHEDCHLGERECQEAKILRQSTPCGHGRVRRVGKALLMETASNSVAEKEDSEQGIDQENIFYRVGLCLAAITRGLYRRVLGTDAVSFGPS
jgi:hypothetical protein